jgi:hypothetical protein
MPTPAIILFGLFLLAALALQLVAVGAGAYLHYRSSRNLSPIPPIRLRRTEAHRADYDGEGEKEIRLPRVRS